MPGSGGSPTTTTTANTPTPTGGNGGGGGNGLHDKFKAKGKLFFGTEIDHYHLNNNPLTTIVKDSFGQITNENSMKWDAIERTLLPFLLYPSTWR
ncbi:endo-1,4-beta-xylanase [Candidatus Bathyarchaeota archaeon]|nr:endo-1,4-beta-xylanase [Candidatus Bathyarchaeota archaeon]